MKTCNAIGNCKHKRELDVNEAGFPHCSYTDFCDYQLPRDSREKEVKVVQPVVCTCDNYEDIKCPIHGAKQ